jgi:hypothetical protein
MKIAPTGAPPYDLCQCIADLVPLWTLLRLDIHALLGEF